LIEGAGHQAGHCDPHQLTELVGQLLRVLRGKEILRQARRYLSLDKATLQYVLSKKL
jgi:hypothetical protein